MLVFLHPRVFSRVAGFPVASPCPWGKLENISYIRMCPSRLSCRFAWQAWHIVTLPTCLIMCRKCQTWRKSRTKCLFFCIHVSCLESLVFLWRRRVYGGSWKTSPIRMCPSRLSCRFAWQAWHFVTFQPACNVWKISRLEEVLHEMLVFLHPRVSSRVSGFPAASPCL